MFIIIKTFVTAAFVVIISEIAKRSTFWGGFMASLPLVSILAIVWLYWETKSTERVSQFCINIFWMVIPSLSFFLILPFLLRKQLPLMVALPLACVLTAGMYALAISCYQKLGIKL